MSASLAVAAVGAGVGAFFGQPALGWAVGSMLGNMLFPAKTPGLPTIEGPRLGDLSVTSSAYGAPIPIMYGAARIAGNIIWSSGLIETRTETEVESEDSGGGGKGGGQETPSQTQVTYTYSVHFAVALCEGTINTVRKIWADSKLIYDVSTGIGLEALIASSQRSEGISVYTGSEDQLPDPLIQSYQGAANTPAHRGLAYIVFNNFQLANYGNRIPNITCEVLKTGSSSFNLITTSTIPTPDGNLFGYHSAAYHDQNGLILFQGQWNASYSDKTVKVYRVLYNGSHVLTNTFDTAIQYVDFAQGNTDIAGALLIKDLSLIWVWVDVDGDIVTTFTLPSNYGYRQLRFSKVGNDLVVGSNFTPKLLKFDFEDGGSPTVSITPSLYYYGINIIGSYVYCGGRTVSGDIYVEVRALSDLSLVNTISTGLNATLRAFCAVDSNNMFIVTGDPYLYRVKQYDLELIGTAITTVTELSYKYGVFRLTDANYHKFYKAQTSPSTTTLASVVTDICRRVELAEIDVSALVDTVDGYTISRQASARDCIQQLQKAYFFDGVESDYTLTFIKRGGATVVTIDQDDLAAREYGQDEPQILVHTRTQDLELPRRVSVLFINKNADYQQGNQHSQRIITSAQGESANELPIVLTDAKAAEISDVLLYDAWTQRHTVEFTLPRKYIYLDPLDIINLSTDNGTYTVRITSIDYGRPGVLNLVGVAENIAIYTSYAEGEDVTNQDQTLTLAGPTKGFLLDIPILRDADDDNGFYVAALGYLDNWPGCLIFKSTDDGQTYYSQMSDTTSVTAGLASTVLASGNTGTWDDTNTVTVTLFGGSLASSTDLAVLNGANAAILGSEIIQFVNVTDNGNESYTLSRLLRGRRGTEWAVSTHALTERFVILSESTLYRSLMDSAELSLSRKYKTVTYGQTLQQTEYITFSNTGIGKKPFSPVIITGSRDGSSNLTISWIRRTRVGGAWRDYVDATIDPEITSWEVDILSGLGVVLRTITGIGSTTYTASYTAAQQTTDFGSTQSSVSVKIYAVGSTVGRGYPGSATV
jgi:hypothetical protein